SERMTDGDGILRPLCRALWSSRDKAKIDEGHFHAVQKRDEVSKHANVEAPTVDEHETHLQLVYIALARRGTACSASASNSRSTSASPCAAVKAKRSLAVPAGTVGGLIATAQKPAPRRRVLMARAASGEP